MRTASTALPNACLRACLRVFLGACVWMCWSPRDAFAGRSFFGRMYGTEVMPERGVELQTWISEENDKYGDHGKETSIWWGPQIGITDQLELSLPLEFQWLVSDTQPANFTLRRFGIEARYRLVSQDPVDAPPFAPLVRLAVKRDVSLRDDVRLEADVAASYDAGPVQLLADVGFIADIRPSVKHTELRPAGGVSVRVDGELRLGAEVYAELSLDSRSESWAVAGPNLAWTHGRFWISGMFGIGLYHVSVAPRVMWGIAF